VVEHAVENGGGDGDIAIEDVCPFLEGLVGNDDGGAALIAVAEDLEEQVGAELVDGQVPEFIDQKDFRACVVLEASLEPIRGLGPRQGVDDVHRRGEPHDLAHNERDRKQE